MLNPLCSLCVTFLCLSSLTAATVAPEQIVGTWELDVEHTVRAQVDAVAVAGGALEAGVARERVQAHAPRTLSITLQEMTLTRPTVTESMGYEVVASTADSLTVHGAQHAAEVVLTWTIIGTTLAMDDVAPDGTQQRLVYIRP